MDSSELIIICITLLFSAFFSGVEIAFISSNRLKIELDRSSGSLNGRIVGYFYKKEQNFVTSLSLGNNLSLVLFGLSITRLLKPVIIAWSIESEALILLIQMFIATIIVLIVVEFSPKAIFQLNPNRFMKTLAIPSFILYLILFIPTSIILFFSILFFKILRVGNNNSERVFSSIDLQHYLQDLNDNSSDIQDFENEMQILQNALDFSKIRGRDCMVPRPEIICIDVDESIESLKTLFIETGISKILIFRENIDNIIGYVHSFELFKSPKKIVEVMRPIEFVPSAIPGKELLELFTKKSANIAVVVDEYGGTAGLVTIEDVIEEIFGDIEDEHDTDDWIEEKISENEYLFAARFEIDQLNEDYDFDLEESEDYDTLGGLIIHYLERIPLKGDELKIEGFRFVVEEVTDRRIEVVRMFIEG
jgi:putative hemolysin